MLQVHCQKAKEILVMEKINLKFDNVVVTKENVEDLGETTAISCLRRIKAVSGHAFDNLYRGLVHDCYVLKKANEIYSDGFDFAQESICYLCNFMGKNLSENCIYKKKELSILSACYRHMALYIINYRTNMYNTQTLEEIEQLEEPSEEKVPCNYRKVDKLIEKMKLTEPEKQTLECYYNNMGFVKISKELCVNVSTIWRRRKSIRKKYIENVGM